MKTIMLIVSSIILFTGCWSNQYTLFQGESTKKINDQSNDIQYEYKIAPQDRVSVMVYKHPELSTVIPDKANDKNGLKVSKDGTIRMPLINSIKVQGLTEKEASTLIEERLSKYVRKPNVKVEIVNKRVYVLGEVKNPGIVPLDNDYITIIQAISTQGGLTTYANRTSVKIIRGNLNNPDISTVDLTNMDNIKVASLMIKPNDIVYVQPNSARATNIAIGEMTPGVGLINSILSTFVNIKYLSK